MKQMFTLASALLLLGTATAVLPASALAAKAADYQAAGAKGGVGYSTTAIDNGRYVVTYTGDPKMKRDKVANFALLRAAEFTQESGFEWFAVLNSSVRDVEAGSANDVAGRTGSFMDSTTQGSTGAGSDQSAGGGGFSMGGATTGGYGGGDVPPSVLERWSAKKSVQAVLIIQMGKGDEANFPGVTKQPDIFEAKSTIEELRAEMK